jgi:hypothetical protein
VERVRSPREIELDGLQAMEESVQYDHGIVALLRNPTPENKATLQFIRRFILDDLDHTLAMTDPALYSKLSRLRMNLILRGWWGYFSDPAPPAPPN